MEEPNSYRDELDKNMWTTKGSRYNGSRRCKRKHEISTACIAILTLYIIGLNLSQFIPALNIQPNLSRYITFSTLIASMGILILSLLEGSKNYLVKSERLYNCANEINKLYGKIRMFKYNCNVGDDSIMGIREAYNELLLRYPDNHEPIDYDLFRVQYRKKDFDISLGPAMWIRLKSVILMYWLYILLIVPLAISLFYLLYHIAKP